MSTLANTVSGAFIAGDPVNAIRHRGVQVFPILPDGVWNPQPDTWAAQIEYFTSMDDRIYVADQVQVPYADSGSDPLNVDNTHLVNFGDSKNDFTGGYTQIIEFITPLEKVLPNQPLRLLTYETGTYVELVESDIANENIIGRIELVFFTGDRVFMSYAGTGQRMRFVDCLRQIGNQLHNYRSVDGNAVVYELSPLPSTDPLPSTNFNIISGEQGVTAGYSLSWPFGDDVPALGDPRLEWIRNASYRMPDNSYMQIPMWPDPQPETAESSSAPPTEKVQEPLEFVEGSVSEPTFLETLHEFYNCGQHQSHIDGQRDIAPIGNPQFIFDGNINTFGNAQSASWQSCSVHFPSVPVSRIVVDRLNSPCALTIDGAKRTISQGNVIDFDPPNIVDRLDIGVGTGNRSYISISVLGPHPIYVDGEPLMVDGVPVYSE